MLIARKRVGIEQNGFVKMLNIYVLVLMYITSGISVLYRPVYKYFSMRTALFT